MARGLDHIVHVVGDLEAAAATYRSLGFRVGPENRHPWGTKNRLIQLPGFFVEILAVADPETIKPSAPGRYSFGAFNRDFLARNGEGLSMLVLESHDPAGDKASFDERGFGAFELLNFARKGRRPDGSETEVGFCIAFARDPASPECGFFTCMQTHPENFWAPEWQRHANGTRAIAAAVLVADNPADHHVFLETFSGVRAVRASSLGISVSTPRGEIQVMERRAFADAYGAEPPGADGMRIAAIDFLVDELGILCHALESGGAAFSRRPDRVVIGPRTAHGAVLAFRE